jgi:5-methyltetrahydrofolate--homocysteine methyltransferase
MNDLLERLTTCIEFGKINKTFPFPASMKGQDGAEELCALALQQGISPNEILNKALIPGMSRIGEKYSKGKAFVPEMLISARAMTGAMKHLKPYFTSGEIKRKGVFVIGTVVGDLHDIGKNIVAMTIEGAGWEVVDLGIDVSTEKFLDAIAKYPDCVVGMSALLSTTMANMGTMVREIRAKHPNKIIIVGGAPVSAEFAADIGASFYSPNPQGAVEYLGRMKQ